ncbi:MAG: DNA polymerase I [Bacteroidetes bacterium]|nr:DNA polymerase I [Bacteroidota bacterium]
MKLATALPTGSTHHRVADGQPNRDQPIAELPPLDDGFDTMLAHYLIEPDKRHGMDYLSQTYLEYIPVSIEELIGKKGRFQGSMRDVDIEKIKEYAAEDADVTLQLSEKLRPELKKNKAEKLFKEVEIPLVNVLASMEYEGVGLDTKFLDDYSVELGKEIIKLEKKIYKLAGTEFNLASPRQLGEVLFDRLKIPSDGKKTKTGQYSTNEEVLAKLAHEHDIASVILDNRELVKLKSTYVDTLPRMINKKTNRLHTSFNQAVAATGRLSSADPNLQNIPIRTEKGREIRKAFIPRDKDYVLLSADYSQVELRLVADISGDKAMQEAFIQGRDIHAATASKVFGVAVDDVTDEMRRNAKMVNFGIIYGITSFGLSQRLNIPRKEAKELIDSYFEMYPDIKKSMDASIAFAQKHGYVETILGRRRYLRDINSRNWTVRGFAERNAINAPLQGTAADMIKVAMINIHKEFKKHKFRSRMILQVHDELVFDTHKDELEEIKPIVEEMMKTALPLKVPVVVDMGSGINWLEAH